MQRALSFKVLIVLSACVRAIALAENAIAFEGKIDIATTRGSETTPLLYTVGPNSLRIEVAGSNSDKSRAGPPNPIDIIDLKSGALTILFPHNRSFVRLKPPLAGDAVPGPRSPTAATMPMPSGGLPPGIGPQSGPSAGMPQMPAMPMMPPMMSEKIELKPTGKKEKILGFDCQQYEIKQRGETMEIWATDQLFPYQPYIRNQAPRFGPRMIEEQWPELLMSRRLFPLRAILRFDGAATPSSRSTEKRDAGGPATGPERFRFEVKSVKPGQIDKPELFQPPEGYTEIQPLPF